MTKILRSIDRKKVLWARDVSAKIREILANIDELEKAINSGYVEARKQRKPRKRPT